MSDDPRFPDRPDHHDFVRLSAVVIEADDLSDAGAEPEQTMAPLVDLPSVLYLARQRLLRAQRHSRAMRNLTKEGEIMVLALYMDAFRAGVRFQQEGGHES